MDNCNWQRSWRQVFPSSKNTKIVGHTLVFNILDLDSAASSIAYSYLASTLFNRTTVPILRTPRPDLYLRAENLYAFEISKLLADLSDLLCIDDISQELSDELLSSSFALVDHNRLSSQFVRQDGVSPKVISIIDHHEDERCHIDADPRIITVPAGSCASLVAQYFQPQWESAPDVIPPELATLLLSSIFIDTHGLKPEGKAEPVDYRAATFLLPRSTFAGQSLADSGTYAIIRQLEARKAAISHLPSRDLLRRDYKEYAFNSAASAHSPILVGISTVPLSLKHWLETEPSPTFWHSMDGWMQERGLDVLGVLCTFNSPRSGKHKRQVVWLVKQGQDALKKALWSGLESNKELQLKRKNMNKKSLSMQMKLSGDGDLLTNGAVGHVWKQRNSKATRKMVAPIIKSIVEGLKS